MEGKFESQVKYFNLERTKRKSFSSCTGGIAVGTAGRKEDTNIRKTSGY